MLETLSLESCPTGIEHQKGGYPVAKEHLCLRPIAKQVSTPESLTFPGLGAFFAPNPGNVKLFGGFIRWEAQKV